MSQEPLPPFSLQAKSLARGIYKHYSGKTYQVLGIGRHSETLEEYVIYKALYDDGDLWIRPLSLFCECVEIDGKDVPRFSLV
jgi:hypothetical protein